MSLFELPNHGFWTIDYFLDHTREVTAKAGSVLQIKSELLYQAVCELIDLLCGEHRSNMRKQLPPESDTERNNTGTDVPSQSDAPGECNLNILGQKIIQIYFVIQHYYSSRHCLYVFKHYNFW